MCHTIHIGQARHHLTTRKTWTFAAKIQQSSARFRYESKGKAEALLALHKEHAHESETFDLFDDGYGWRVRMFENGEFCCCV